MDILPKLLVLGGVALLITLIAAAWLTWENVGSRNLALATGTLAAAALLYVIQVPFELRRSIDRDRISTEVTVDLAVPVIRQWTYTGNIPWRMGIETDASRWLAANNPAAFAQERGKLTADFVLFSLVSFLTHDEFDWQLSKVSYKGRSAGIFTSVQRVSKDHECAAFEESGLRARLSQAGNLFAGVPLTLVSGKLCLPPRSSIELSERSLVIRNRICQLSFTVELSGLINYAKPGSSGQTPQLPGGGQQFETRLVGLNVETIYFALRAQHRDSSKYREWCTRVINDAREWFES